MLELKDICKYYNPGTVNEMCLFHNYQLQVKDGEFVSVVGSNGSGKTSMLNIICGSIPVESGKSCWMERTSQKRRNTSAAAALEECIRTRRLAHVPACRSLRTCLLQTIRAKPMDLGAALTGSGRITTGSFCGIESRA